MRTRETLNYNIVLKDNLNAMFFDAFNIKSIFFPLFI